MGYRMSDTAPLYALLILIGGCGAVVVGMVALFKYVI